MGALLDSRFQPESVILTATSTRHYHAHPTGQLSIKTMSKGRAIYALEGGRSIAVDDSGYLVLNDQQPYTITIESPAPLTSFCIFFPPGQAADVLQALLSPDDALLADPSRDPQSPEFFPTLLPHDDLVSPAIRHISQAVWTGPIETGWLEMRLADLLAKMLHGQGLLNEQAGRLRAQRPSTRTELQTRLLIARDFMYASFEQPLSLEGIARVAMLSPYHFLRSFKQLFGETPHACLTRLRLDRARYLLLNTQLSITEICFALGFSSPGSFSMLFQRATGFAPQRFRVYHHATEQDSRG